MTPSSTCHGDWRAQRERGAALLHALLLMAVGGLTLLAVLAYATRETALSAHDRARSVAAAVAEGEVDAMLSRMARAATSELPCAATRTDTSAHPETIDVSVVVSYRTSSGPTDCPLGAASTPTSAVVRAVATARMRLTGPQVRRSFEAVVDLTPVDQMATGAWGRAIFGLQGVSFAGAVDLRSADPARAPDVSTGGSLQCNNSQHFAGSVFAERSVSFAGTCLVDRDVRAGSGLVVDSNGSRITGQASVRDGDARLVPGVQVGGGVVAGGSVTWDGCPTGCRSGSADAPAPPGDRLPEVVWDADTAAKWSAAGWADVVTVSSCTLLGAANGPGQWILDHAATLTRPTVLRTPCQVVLQPNQGVVTLSADLAVVADGGVALNGNLTFRSSTAASRRLLLVQPLTSVQPPCSTDAIQLNNQVVVEDTVTTLLYSPCSIRKANLSRLAGQILSGGTVTVDNALSMSFVPMALPGQVATADHRCVIVRGRWETT